MHNICTLYLYVCTYMYIRVLNTYIYSPMHLFMCTCWMPLRNKGASLAFAEVWQPHGSCFVLIDLSLLEFDLTGKVSYKHPFNQHHGIHQLHQQRKWLHRGARGVSNLGVLEASAIHLEVTMSCTGNLVWSADRQSFAGGPGLLFGHPECQKGLRRRSNAT